MAKKLSLAEQIQARTQQNIVKSRSGSGKTTYLDRFVSVLTDDEGNPTEPKTRVQIVGEISAQIVLEQVETDKASGARENDFELTEDGDGPDDILLATVNKKVKNQVASAIANNQNSTSLSFNEAYKDKWMVVKGDGGTISLAPKSAE